MPSRPSRFRAVRGGSGWPRCVRRWSLGVSPVRGQDPGCAGAATRLATRLLDTGAPAAFGLHRAHPGVILRDPPDDIPSCPCATGVQEFQTSWDTPAAPGQPQCAQRTRRLPGRSEAGSCSPSARRGPRRPVCRGGSLRRTAHRPRGLGRTCRSGPLRRGHGALAAVGPRHLMGFNAVVAVSVVPAERFQPLGRLAARYQYQFSAGVTTGCWEPVPGRPEAAVLAVLYFAPIRPGTVPTYPVRSSR